MGFAVNQNLWASNYWARTIRIQIRQTTRFRPLEPKANVYVYRKQVKGDRRGEEILNDPFQQSKSSFFKLFWRFGFAVMQRQNTYNCKASINFVTDSNRQLNLRHHPFIVPSSSPERIRLRLKCLSKGRIASSITTTHLEFIKLSPKQCFKVKVADVNQGELSDEDDELCPVECVREVKTDEEFLRILDKAKETESLVVVDFYRTSCGSCKYIEQGFAKLCKGSGDQEAAVIFLKHNVIDEYDEQSEIADRLRIKTVPLFHFYKNGVLLEAFPTRDKERIVAAIRKYSSPASQDLIN
ncbi:hypothetical protein FNV43_RR11836 [Rhamnella rubrinervis]|uniref:Thioredoxin-like 4, chloroplastic n=1 Tax=Rhamnella rubrinervis TaxID=2594499 RepID=A0A8K0H694_9ROSA|nr:hypothetical protein FNV43_RR11836 [Rhamnella rubrinervis]